MDENIQSFRTETQEKTQKEIREKSPRSAEFSASPRGRDLRPPNAGLFRAAPKMEASPIECPLSSSLSSVSSPCSSFVTYAARDTETSSIACASLIICLLFVHHEETSRDTLLTPNTPRPNRIFQR